MRPEPRHDHQPDGRRCRPVRLTDIPLDIRMRAARQACRSEPDVDLKLELFAVALQPSSTVYWVAW